MIDAKSHRSVAFFDAQFRRGAEGAAARLNPFETAVLPHLGGTVLDLGCGLGNLSLAAAARGCHVIAIDASPAAVASLTARARQSNLPLEAHEADVRTFAIGERVDAVVAIGLLMFMDCPTARTLLERWQAWVKPGGLFAVNVLVRGTTYLEMFEPGDHCLWEPGDLRAAFSGWDVRHDAIEDFPAPERSVKRFLTLIARKPAAGAPLQ